MNLTALLQTIFYIGVGLSVATDVPRWVAIAGGIAGVILGVLILSKAL